MRKSKRIIAIFMFVVMFIVCIFTYFYFTGYPWDRDVASKFALFMLKTRNFEVFNFDKIEYDHINRVYTVYATAIGSGKELTYAVEVGNLENIREFMNDVEKNREIKNENFKNLRNQR